MKPFKQFLSEAKNVDVSLARLFMSLRSYFEKTVGKAIQDDLQRLGLDVSVRVSSVDDRLVEYWVEGYGGKGILSFEVYVTQQDTMLVIHLANPQWRPRTSGPELDDPMKDLVKKNKQGAPVLVLKTEAVKKIEVFK